MKKQQLKNILFLDIETVSEYKEYESMNPSMKNAWYKKCKYLMKDNDSDGHSPTILYNRKAGIYSEFAKIVCISVGYLVPLESGGSKLRIRSIASHDEIEILYEFKKLLELHFNNIKKHRLCGHNIKEFDVPFICRRMIVHGISLPDILNVMGLKPWQTAHLLDTMQLWRFGDYKNFTSLSLLAAVFNIPTPKDDIDGSQVGSVYWIEDDLDRIVTYCQKDVVTVAQVFLKLNLLSIINEENIEITNKVE